MVLAQIIEVDEPRYKCMVCKVVLYEEHLVDGKCHVCGIKPEKMCPRDRAKCSHPAEDIFGVLDYCPTCHKPICPICGCHDVMILSRITGYIQDVGGFNAAKAQELKDRTHYTVA